MKKALSSLALAAGALFAAAPAGAELVVSFTPSTSHVAVGGTVNVQMSISGLGDEILSAFDFNALWDESILSWNLLGLSCGFLGVGECLSDTQSAGELGAMGYSYESDADLAAAQADSFTIATFQFKGLANGMTTLALGADPDFQRNFVGREFASLNVRVDGACIAVGTGSCDSNGQQPGSGVPEPGSIVLAGLGLLTAVVARRRRRDQATV